MGWLDSDLPNKKKQSLGGGRIVEYRDEKDLCDQLTAVIRKYDNVLEILKSTEESHERYKTYSNRLEKQYKEIRATPRKFRVVFNNGPVDVEVKAKVFEVNEKSGYQFFASNIERSLVAHFDYDIVAYVIEVQETV